MLDTMTKQVCEAEKHFFTSNNSFANMRTMFLKNIAFENALDPRFAETTLSQVDPLKFFTSHINQY